MADESTTPTTGWKVLDNDGISVRFDERGRLQIALNSAKGFVYQVTSWRPRTAEMLSDWLSEQDWEAIRKRALEVDARAFDGPDPILNPPQRHGSIGPSLETDCIPALDCVCGFTATGKTWSEAGENLEAHLTEKEVPDGR